jgi:hypothetical protein
MRGLKQVRSVRVISLGHAFIQNVRRGHYELATDVNPRHRLATAFAELLGDDNAIGDKGYIGTGILTPYRKPAAENSSTGRKNSTLRSTRFAT